MVDGRKERWQNVNGEMTAYHEAELNVLASRVRQAARFGSGCLWWLMSLFAWKFMSAWILVVGPLSEGKSKVAMPLRWDPYWR